MITEQQRTFYQKNGYLILPDLFSPAAIAALKKETVAIFRGERGSVAGLIDVTGEMSDADVLKQYVAIHFPHKLSALLQETLFHAGVLEVLTALVSPNMKCMQSMLFVKGPGKAGQSWHQDEYYIPTRDKSLTGVWIAIDDARVDNGCLWIIPGRPGYIMRRVPGQSPEFADLDTVDVTEYERDSIPVEARSGSVVLFNGYTLHASRRNKTKDCFRAALVNHYMSAESMLPWDQDGRLPPTEDLRDIVMVAGWDPYEWKGTEDKNRPFLRPETTSIKPVAP